MDGQPLLGLRSGIGRYTETLYRYLTKELGVDVTLSFNRIFKNPNVDRGQYPRWMNHRYPYKVIRRLMAPNLLYSWPADAFTRDPFDIYHGTNFTHLPLKNGKSVVTIHDLSFLHYPEYTSSVIYKHHSRWVPYSAAKSDHIIADSEYTKNDIIRLLNIPDNKISVVHLSADTQFRPMTYDEYRPVLDKYHLPSKYILFVGTVEPRKNLMQLIRSYHVIQRLIQEKIVIVGAKGWKYSPIFRLVEDLHLTGTTIFTGYIDDSDLPAVYNGASVLVMPSFYEGYGLPLIEAMKCGVPVIGSNVSSIPEIIGEAGLLVDPNSTAELSNALLRILDSSTEHDRYSRLALERAKHFSWRKTAQQTLEVYKKVQSSE